MPGRFSQVIRIFYENILGDVRSVVKVKRDIKGIGVCDKSNNNDYKNMYDAVIAIIPECRIIDKKPVDFHLSSTTIICLTVSGMDKMTSYM